MKDYSHKDSDGNTEIITYMTCNFKGKLIAMVINVYPVCDTKCIPWTDLRLLFPEICSKYYNPKEKDILTNVGKFEEYHGCILHRYELIILPTSDMKDS